MANALANDIHILLFAEFEEEEDPANKSFFSEIIASISDIKFSKDGRFILSRDYLTLKLWDLRVENRPYKTIRYILLFFYPHKRFSFF